MKIETKGLPDTPKLDRFDFLANQAFLAGLSYYWPLPQRAVHQFKSDSRRMRADYRQMEAEGICPDDATMLKALKKRLFDLAEAAK